MSSATSRIDPLQAGFDQLAARYDADMERQRAIMDRYRRVIRGAIGRHFPPRATVLELGCGTGEETLELARSGRRVVATDPAPRMLAAAQAKLLEHGLLKQVWLVKGSGPSLEPSLRRAGGLPTGWPPVSAVLSSMGPLNCESDLEGLGGMLTRLLPASAPLVLVPMGRYVPWEVLVGLARGRPRQGLQRLGKGPISVPLGDERAEVWYEAAPRFIARLGGGFERLEQRGLGLFLPPPALHGLEVVPGLLPFLDRLDGLLAHRPLLRQIGDHILMVLRRRGP